MMRWKMFLAVLAFAFLLSGCQPYVFAEQPAAGAWFDLTAYQTVGQTLVARYDGLNGVQLLLAPGASAQGEITLHLRASPTEMQDLALARMAVVEVKEARFYRFDFPLQPLSKGQSYYFFLEMSGAGHLQVGATSPEAYLQGALYLNQKPQEAQMAFQLEHQPWRLWLGLLNEGLQWGWMLTLATLLFVLPGWVLLDIIWPGWQDWFWPVKLGVSAGMSLVIYPVLMLWTDLLGIHLGALYAWLPLLFGLFGIAWRLRWYTPGDMIRKIREAFSWKQRSVIIESTFILLLALVVFTRLWAIRSLDMPMWGDSYHHTVITQLIVDSGGLFDRWQPYAEMQSFTYHFGFHSAAAVFHWVSGMQIPQTILWVGQVLNILAVISLYALTYQVSGGNRWAGLLAVLIAGLGVSMPMFYVNWGRYTQLAGHILYAGIVVLVWQLWDQARPRWQTTLPVWLLLGGLALTHYRVLIFALASIVPLWFWVVWREGLIRAIKRLAWLGIGAGVIFLPWFVTLFAGQLMKIFANQVTVSPEKMPAAAKIANTIGDLGGYLPMYLWILLAFSLGWGLWRRERGAYVIGLGWFILLLATNPNWISLPGAGVITNFAVFIAAYIPAAVLIGLAGGALIQGVVDRASNDLAQASSQKSWQSLVHPGLSILIAASIFLLGGLGAEQRRKEVDTVQHALVARPDLHAMQWIQENIPADATFLVNSFLAYNESVSVGSDGGWWLAYLTQRKSTLPPITYGSEKEPYPGYRQSVRGLTSAVINLGVTAPETLSLLAEQGVTHVYLGQRQGRVNFDGPVIEPGQLLYNPAFELVYHQDRVWIFQYLPER